MITFFKKILPVLVMIWSLINCSNTKKYETPGFAVLCQVLNTNEGNLELKKISSLLEQNGIYCAAVGSLSTTISVYKTDLAKARNIIQEAKNNGDIETEIYLK